MANNKLDITLPEGYQSKDLLVKLSKVAVDVGPIQTFRSFRIVTLGGMIQIGDKNISEIHLFNILKEHGMSSTVPVSVKFTTQATEVLAWDWKPFMYGGPKLWYFKWDGVECSVCSDNNIYYIRVHDMSQGVGEDIMEKLRVELLSRWTNPTPDQTIIIFVPIKHPVGYTWYQVNTRQYRSLDTIYINSDIKDSLISQLTSFYDSAAVYDKFGVTWKRVHLLWGLPGTGKTSMVVALASRFKKNIAKITVTPDMNSSHLEMLFSTIQNNTFLLIEDVDSLFIEREAKTNLDFSTVLNCLDGVSTKRGLVIFMTTNHVGKLDAAFVRPGRVDQCIEFTLPNTEVLCDALKMLAPDFSHEHDDFIRAFGEGMSIAALQKHLFACIMSKNDTIMNYEK